MLTALIFSLFFQYSMAKESHSTACGDLFSIPSQYNISSNPDKIKIEYKSLRIPDRFIAITAKITTTREVRYRIPNGKPPKGGWPVVFIFQGTLYPVQFTRFKGDKFGLFYEARLIETLLENGYAVIAPDALGHLAWETNSPKYTGENSRYYNQSSDYRLIENTLTAIDGNLFGELNRDLLFATGISSGGYMTSRMGIAFEDRFKALAIQSASYATCLGNYCEIPSELSRKHPPILIVHGTQDNKVPIVTASEFYEILKRNGVEAEFYKKDAGHEWFPESPELIVKYFNQKRK